MKYKVLVIVVFSLCSLSVLGQEPSQSLKSFLDKELVQNYKSDEKVDYKSLISALGALAGQAVQQGLRDELIVRKNIPEKNVFAVVETKSSEKYYFSPFFDEFLLKSQNGIDFWSVLTRGTSNTVALPSVDQMAERNAKLVGDKSYGSHAVDKKYLPAESAIDSLKNNWPKIYKKLNDEKLNPLSWGWEITYYTKNNILSKDIGIPKAIAIQLYMESAISMSKYDLDSGAK